MAMLLKTYEEQEVRDDDPQISYMISAWTRICKVLGKDFEKYLPMVMGPVLQTAAMKPEVALLDNEDMEDVEQDVDWQFVSLGEQQNFGIKTSGLEDKATACEMLVCYARELKEGFANYAEEVVKLMVPMLKFYFHDGVRSAAAQSLPCLLECAKIKGVFQKSKNCFESKKMINIVEINQLDFFRATIRRGNVGLHLPRLITSN